MAQSVQHRIYFGNQADSIDEDSGYLLSPVFTFDRTDITFDSTIRTFDEMI